MLIGGMAVATKLREKKRRESSIFRHSVNQLLWQNIWAAKASIEKESCPAKRDDAVYYNIYRPPMKKSEAPKFY